MNCKTCIFDNNFWVNFSSDSPAEVSLVCTFLQHGFTPECLDQTLKLCGASSLDACKLLCSALKNLTTEQVISILRDNPQDYCISSGGIPQFSDLTVCTHGVVDALIRSSLADVSFEKMGFLLRVEPRSKAADLKYGENQAKTAESLGLCSINKRHGINATAFGIYFSGLTNDEKNRIIPKLILRIPIIQRYFILGCDFGVIEQSLSILKDSTRTRRLTNINALIKRVQDALDNGI